MVHAYTLIGLRTLVSWKRAQQVIVQNYFTGTSRFFLSMVFDLGEAPQDKVVIDDKPILQKFVTIRDLISHITKIWVIKDPIQCKVLEHKSFRPNNKMYT